MNDKHIFLCGGIGVGKSTLLLRLADALGGASRGFVTVKSPPSSDGNCRIYLRDIRRSIPDSEENLVGICGACGGYGRPEIFNLAGCRALSDIAPGSVVMMDELGTMENHAQEFQAAVLKALDAPCTVLGIIKPKQTAFLCRIREHPRTVIYEINSENRNELYAHILHEHGISLKERDKP